MKPQKKISPVLACALAGTVLVGCSTIGLPPAKGYAVKIGNEEYWAKSVRFHGRWVEIETEHGPVWARDAVVFIKPKID